MWKELVFVFVTLEAILGATLVPCPDGSTTCRSPTSHLETKSFEFLSKFSQKQYRSIVSLSMSNASVNKVDPKLKYLKNLQYLDLSHNNVQITSIPPLANLNYLKLNGNNLKYINLTALPPNIATLDLSHNLLAQIPKDWRSLKSLQTLHLYKNPIDCDCNNVVNYDRLVKSGIVVPESITCHSPKQYVGKLITSVNCSLDDIMLDDEQVEGSGARDIFADNEDRMHVPFVQEKEEDETEENNTFIDDVPEENVLSQSNESILGGTLEEGSGDEGSGDGAFVGSGILGCIENCSTPGPVGAGDDVHASPLPNPFEQAKMIFDDINILSEDETTISAISASAPVIEPKLVKEVKPQLNNAADKNDEVEIIANGTKTGELERASIAPRNSTAVYAVIGVGLFLAVVFIICFVKKRKAKRRNKNRGEIPMLAGEEMKPLTKPVIMAANEKPNKNSANIPEHIPLINGQNGKPKDDTPTLKSFTPLAHPEMLQEDEPEHIRRDSPEEVDMREKSIPELLTPQRERVTIIETEIPDSIPRTPLLVHRQRNSDGEIVTVVP